MEYIDVATWKRATHFYEKDGKVYLPFSVQVHHSFVDGVHIGKLAKKLQCYLDNFGQVPV